MMGNVRNSDKEQMTGNKCMQNLRKEEPSRFSNTIPPGVMKTFVRNELIHSLVGGKPELGWRAC